MYSPASGKIVYGKGRICIAFSHYNAFGLSDNGARNDHTADAYLTVSEEDGKNDMVSHMWSCSHSLD